MSKKKTHVHWTNPPNPHLEAKLEAWRRYTDAYHSDAPIEEQNELHKAYESACENYKNNPQTIFNEGSD